jgi:hypothetical protein
MFEYFHRKEPSKNAKIVWEDWNKLIVEIYMPMPVNLSHIKMIDKYYCGYVAFDKVLFRDISDIKKFSEEVWVHGGVTFLEEDGDTIIFGFDCAHAFDFEEPKDLDFVKNEIDMMERDIRAKLKNQMELP